MLPRLGLSAFAAAVLLAGVGAPLFRNEGLRAQLAAEAMASSDWLTPRLYGEPHLTKPPGMGVLIAACSLPFGEVTPLTARLPSALAGAALMLMVGVTFARRFDADAGLAAAAIVPCSVLWLDRVPSAEIDLVQAAWVAASLLALLHAAEGHGGWWFVALFCVGGGLFTKWTGPAFFYLTAVAWLGWRRRLRLLVSPPHLVALGLLVVVFGLWLWNAHRQAGADLFATLEREAMMRLSPARHPRPYPWDELLTFPLSFLLGCLPAALLLLPSVRTAHLDERQRALVQLAWGWLLTSVVFWTVVPGHRPRHILPAQPAVAILCAAAWVAWRDGRWSFGGARPALATTLVVWLGVKLAFVGVMTARPDVGASAARLRELVPPGEVLGLVGLKDEGLLFAYGRPARRGGRRFSLMPEAASARGEVVARLRDSQGEPLKLVRE